MKSSIELNSDKFAYSKNKNSSYLSLPPQQQIDYNIENEDNSFCKTPTNTCNDEMKCRFSLGVSNSNMIVKESQSPIFVDYSNSYQQNQPVLNHTNNHAYTMPQFTTNTVFPQNGQYHSMTSDNLKTSNFPTYHTQSDSNSASFTCMLSLKDKNDQNNEGMNLKKMLFHF